MFDEIDFLFDEINNTLNKENKNSRLIYHSNFIKIYVLQTKISTFILFKTI